jgi:hypothetical protein
VFIPFSVGVSGDAVHEFSFKERKTSVKVYFLDSGKSAVFWYFNVTRDFPDFACAPYF